MPKKFFWKKYGDYLETLFLEIKTWWWQRTYVWHHSSMQGYVMATKIDKLVNRCLLEPWLFISLVFRTNKKKL